MTKNENLNEYQDSYKEDSKYFDENHFFLEHFATRLCKVLRERSYKSVLSLGIGHQVVNGTIRKEFSHGLQLHTILEGSIDLINDLSKSIEVDREKIEFVHTYFEDYDTEKQYDIIEMGFILEHVDDPGFILNKFKKFLKPGGTIFIGVPNARSLHRLIGFEAGLLDDLYKLSEYDIRFGHKRFFDIDSIKDLVTSAGYNICSVSGLLLKPITTAQMVQLGWKSNIYNALLKIGDSFPEISNSILIEAAL